MSDTAFTNRVPTTLSIDHQHDDGKVSIRWQFAKIPSQAVRLRSRLQIGK